MEERKQNNAEKYMKYFHINKKERSVSYIPTNEKGI